MRYLIGYDIPDDKRLQRLHREMCKFATPLQYSLFLYEGSQADWQLHFNKILNMLNEKEDDLRVYPISTLQPSYFYGKPVFPEGIFWSIMPC